MERNELLEIAEYAGFDVNVWDKLFEDDELGYNVGGIHENLEAFAKLVEDASFKRWAAQTNLAIEEAILAEREACAKICDSVNNYDNPMTSNDVADAIRARGTNE